MERERGMLHLKDLNLICALCGGYFIDATTIVECCHTFCKTCIVKHLTSDNVDNSKDTGKKRNGTEKFCPMCEVQLHKTKPLLSLRPDDRIQKLVYKAVPKLYEEEVKRRYMFYAERRLENTRECDREMDAILRYNIFHPKDMFSICLEYYDESRKDSPMSDESEEHDPNEVHRRYLHCAAEVTILHLKKLLRKKFMLTVDHPVHIYYKGNQRKGLEDQEEEVLQESYSLMDIAYIFEWDPKASPMKIGYQILKRQVVVKSAEVFNGVMVAESSASSPLKETIMHRGIDNINEEQTEQSGQMRDLRLGKKKLGEKSDNVFADSPVPVKRLRRKSLGSGRNCTDTTSGVSDLVDSSKTNLRQGQEVAESVTIEDSNDTSDFSPRVEKENGSPAASPMETEELVVAEDDEIMETEVGSQIAESVEDQQDTSQDIEEVVVDIDGEPSQDFILQEVQQAMDASEELEEDDDEDRLRICDPEEIPEDRVSEEYIEEKVEENLAQPDVDEGKTENCVEEEAEVSRKESKSRRKNKKAKHHHRHRRDYSPAPEATIVSSDDKTDSLKLKVKITRSDSETSQGKNRGKQDERYYKLSDGHSSPRQSKHKNYVISEGMYNNTEQSPSHSNNDEDSINSHSTDDHEVRSVASSKEGQDEVLNSPKETPLHNGNQDSSKTNNREIPNKEKLNQLRQVRHKNITPPPPRTLPNTTISKVSAEEASKNTMKTLLTSNPNSIVTLKKVTAEEAEENKVMKTYNNLGSKRPSLEIIPMVGVNNTSAITKTNGNKTLLNENKQKKLAGVNPVVQIMKNNHINSLNPNQNSMVFSKVKCTNVDISNNSEVLKNSKESKISAEKKAGIKKRENSGVLDLSEKSTRSSCSSPASEGSNSPSPHQPVLSMAQPLINRHLAAMNSPRRSSSSSPPVTASLPKGSPTRPMQHPAYLSDLVTLSDTAVHYRNIKAAQVKDGMRRQVPTTQNKCSPQIYPSMPSPGKTPTRASPTQLKIPTPNLSSKFATRPKVPSINSTSNSSLPNRPVAVNRPIMPSSRVVAGRTINVFPNMLTSQSAAVAKKQADINGRSLNIPPPPPLTHISSLFKMENMQRKFDLEEIARATSAERKAKVKGFPYIPKQVQGIQESNVPKIPSS